MKKEPSMKIGAHVSAAGGLFNAPLEAARMNLETFQFFARSPQGGKAMPISDEDLLRFHNNCETFEFEEYYIHAPYVINLASKEKRIREATIDILRLELERGSMLKAAGVMFHPGSASGVGEEEGVKLVIHGMKQILDDYKGSCRLLVEISAGAGMVIADTFDEVGAILKGVGDDSVGVCFDTAHAFASGYDLRTPEAVATTMKQFDEQIGLEKLLISHCNDSKVDIGGKKDRHEHIGKGFIGLEGFRAIVNLPAFKNVHLLLETPLDDDREKDIAALKTLRGPINQ